MDPSRAESAASQARTTRDVASTRARTATRAGPSPRLLVAGQLLHAAGSLALGIPRMAVYLARRARYEADLRDDLTHAVEVAPEPALAPPRRAPVVFVSCAERSGELHAVHLVRALRTRLAALGAPAPRLIGLGGALLAAEGVELVGRPVDHATMGFGAALGALPYYVRLITDAARALGGARPDVFVPVDSPALHVPLARIAHAHGIQVVHFVTPQYWGWAPWRVRGYRRAVDRALTILPFEPPWFARHGVRAVHVGHPIRDSWGDAPSPAATARALVLLPGSRRSVLDRNLPWMLDAAQRLRERQGAAMPIVVAHEDAGLRPAIEEHLERAGAAGRVEIAIGPLAETLSRARASLAVSGTVLLELVRARLPAVVVYRLSNRVETWAGRRFLTTPWFAAPNLLAGREVLPEYAFAGDGPREAVDRALERCYNDEAWREDCRAGLELADRRLGPCGAVERAAAQVLAVAFEASGSQAIADAAATAVSSGGDRGRDR